MSSDVSLTPAGAAPATRDDARPARTRDLPARPPISTPHRDLLAVERARLARQPGLGLAGLAFVLPVAVLLGVGAGGLEESLLVLGPLTTFALPVIAMIAFWWEDWPGTMLREPFVGVANTLLVACAGVVLTIVGQAIVGPTDLAGIFDPGAAPDEGPAFPTTMALGIAVFVSMLHVTLVLEGAPFRRLPRIPAGIAALGAAWLAGLAIYEATVPTDLLERGELGTILVCVSVLQLMLYVVWRGWPIAHLEPRPRRFAVASAIVVGGGAGAYGALSLAGLDHHTIAAVASAAATAILVVGMLFEGALDHRLGAQRARAANAAAVVVVAAALYAGLRALADSASWTRADAVEWTAYGLNAIAIAIILHVAISQRWPFAQPSPDAVDAGDDTPR